MYHPREDPFHWRVASRRVPLYASTNRLVRPAIAKLKSCGTDSCRAADVPIMVHATGMATIHQDRSHRAHNSTPNVKIVVGHGGSGPWEEDS